MKEMEGELQAESPHFFAPMFNDFHKRLRIPNSFVKHIPEGSSEKAILHGPTGTTWHVQLNRTENALYLDDGWANFATAHSLSLGEFLLFRKESNMILTVNIFGTNYLEKENGFEVTKSQEALTCCVPKKRGRPPKSDRKDNIRASLGLCSPTLNAGRRQHKFKSGPRKSHQYQRLDSPNDEPDTFTTVGAMEAAKALTLRLSNPSFRVLIRQSYLQYLPIPQTFADKHFSAKIETVTLRVSSGRMWKTCLYIEKVGQYKIVRGWKAFSVGMELEVGDICVFELLQNKDIVLKAYIFKDL